MPKSGLTVINSVIAAGQSLSDPIDCSAGDVVLIQMPDNWSYGELTFQVSSDGSSFYDLLNLTGHEVTVPVTPNTAMIMPREAFYAAGFLKLRSGRSQDPMPQQQNRQFAITLMA